MKDSCILGAIVMKPLLACISMKSNGKCDCCSQPLLTWDAKFCWVFEVLFIFEDPEELRRIMENFGRLFIQFDWNT